MKDLKTFLQLAPQWFIKDMGLEMNYEEADQSMTHIENVGDLEELFQALTVAVATQNLNVLREIASFHHQIMESCTEMGFEDFRQLTDASRFKSKYPNLYDTMEVWAWG
jgi:hypothetical protein